MNQFKGQIYYGEENRRDNHNSSATSKERITTIKEYKVSSHCLLRFIRCQKNSMSRKLAENIFLINFHEVK